MRTRLLRILDANLNRASEALRVCEDVVRLGLHARGLTAPFKSLRHSVRRAASRFPVPYRTLVASRDVGADVGARSLESNGRRLTLEALFVRNAKRAAEGLRVLEECSKLFSLASSKRFQKLRFAVYELEKKALSKL